MASGQRLLREIVLEHCTETHTDCVVAVGRPADTDCFAEREQISAQV